MILLGGIIQSFQNVGRGYCALEGIEVDYTHLTKVLVDEFYLKNSEFLFAIPLAEVPLQTKQLTLFS